MRFSKTKVTKIIICNVSGLDPIAVYIENPEVGKGKITITCYGKAWTAYWPAMSQATLEDFFCDSHTEYLAENLSSIQKEVFDIDAINKLAEKQGVYCGRDDPWNDYEFLGDLFGEDSSLWHEQLPKRPNHEYVYLCKIINAVKAAFAEMRVAA